MPLYSWLWLPMETIIESVDSFSEASIFSFSFGLFLLSDLEEGNGKRIREGSLREIKHGFEWRTSHEDEEFILKTCILKRSQQREHALPQESVASKKNMIKVYTSSKQDSRIFSAFLGSQGDQEEAEKRIRKWRSEMREYLSYRVWDLFHWLWERTTLSIPWMMTFPWEMSSVVSIFFTHLFMWILYIVSKVKETFEWKSLYDFFLTGKIYSLAT